MTDRLLDAGDYEHIKNNGLNDEFKYSCNDCDVPITNKQWVEHIDHILIADGKQRMYVGKMGKDHSSSWMDVI